MWFLQYLEHNFFSWHKDDKIIQFASINSRMVKPDFSASFEIKQENSIAFSMSILLSILNYR